jgi:hypothetical protein
MLWFQAIVVGWIAPSAFFAVDNSSMGRCALNDNSLLLRLGLLLGADPAEL